jgi:hypothetical protein
VLCDLEALVGTKIRIICSVACLGASKKFVLVCVLRRLAGGGGGGGESGGGGQELIKKLLKFYLHMINADTVATARRTTRLSLYVQSCFRKRRR